MLPERLWQAAEYETLHPACSQRGTHPVAPACRVNSCCPAPSAAPRSIAGESTVAMRCLPVNTCCWVGSRERSAAAVVLLPPLLPPSGAVVLLVVVM